MIDPDTGEALAENRYSNPESYYRDVVKAAGERLLGEAKAGKCSMSE